MATQIASDQINSIPVSVFDYGATSTGDLGAILQTLIGYIPIYASQW